MKKSSLLVFITSLSDREYEMSKEDFEQRVEAVTDARDKWIGLIESRLNDLTGLRLGKKQDYQDQYHENLDETPIRRSGKGTIVVFPTDLIERDLGTDDQYEVWKFILARIVPRHVFKESKGRRSGDLEDDAKAQLEDIEREVLRLDDQDFGISDVLVVFSYNEHMIKLYAQVIAYHSKLLCAGAEDLTFVVLAHELAHAYTMAGYDVDGFRGIILNKPECWNKCVVEGLAQYYTEAICRQMEKKHPQFMAAFKGLLSNQTEPYTWHKHWFGGEKAHERVRHLLLRYRHNLDSGYFIYNLGLSHELLKSIL